MMKRRLLLFFFIFACLFVVTGYAHPGGTDEHGGHFDYESGEYHYHHGYPAHHHGFGTCPYDFDDRTGENSGTPGGESSTRYHTTAPRPVSSSQPSSYRAKSTSSFIQKHLLLFLVVIAIVAVLIYIAIAIKMEKQAEKERQAQFEKEKQEAIAFYATRNLRYLSNMPDMYYVDDKHVPYEYNKPKECRYGITLDIYVTSFNSDVYHRHGCKHISYHPPHNACLEESLWEFSRKRPCSICKPAPLSDFSWYKEYLYHVKRCEKFEITPKLNPQYFVPPLAPQDQEPSSHPLVTQSTSVGQSPSPLSHFIAQTERAALTPPLQSPPLPSVNESVKVTPAIPQQETIVPAPSPTLLQTFHTKYPKSWYYIRKYARNSDSYLSYYCFVWGALQEHHGDGIIYGTLTNEEQSLVNYPSVGKRVWLSSESSDTYHSTPNCYILLKSVPIEADAIHAIVKKRCTKCVPPRSSA